MKITVIFSQVEGPAVAALTDTFTALVMNGVNLEISLQCEAPDAPELPTELVHPLDYAAAQEGLLQAILPV